MFTGLQWWRNVPGGKSDRGWLPTEMKGNRSHAASERFLRRHPIGRVLVAMLHDSEDVTTLTRYLTHEGYDVRRAGSGVDALRQVESIRPDVVLLDVTVPEVDGPAVCRRLKQDPKTASVGVIMLIGRAEEGDTIEAFALGADDCVTKPFSPRELLARVGVVVRRGKRVAGEEAGYRLKVGDLEIDRARFEVRMNGRPVDLTRKEFDLLATLVKAPGRVFRRRELLDLIWRPDGFVALDLRTVDVHMARLRRKFMAARLPGPRIDTVRGVGYRFRALDAG